MGLADAGRASCPGRAHSRAMPRGEEGATAVPSQGLGFARSVGVIFFAVSEDKVQWCHFATLLWHLNHARTRLLRCPGQSQPQLPRAQQQEERDTSSLHLRPAPPTPPGSAAPHLQPLPAGEPRAGGRGRGGRLQGHRPLSRGFQAHPGAPTSLPAPSCPAQEPTEGGGRKSPCSPLSLSPPNLPS